MVDVWAFPRVMYELIYDLNWSQNWYIIYHRFILMYLRVDICIYHNLMYEHISVLSTTLFLSQIYSCCIYQFFQIWLMGLSQCWLMSLSQSWWVRWSQCWYVILKKKPIMQFRIGKYSDVNAYTLFIKNICNIDLSQSLLFSLSHCWDMNAIIFLNYTNYLTVGWLVWRCDD